jgi:3-hydroxyisobutyrate dehydrogenase-like beta-hydroxyacid dehydrogenase
VDLGTMTPADTRRYAALFAEKGAFLLDVPVSGGGGGAEAGTLRMFAAGDRGAYERCLPILTVLGDPETVVYCGESGNGHVVKGVNQMAMGLANAALIEAVAFGVQAGVDCAVLKRAVGGDTGWRGLFDKVAGSICEGAGREVGVKSGQLEYYLGEAAEKGFELPITAAVHGVCRDGEKIVMEANRLSASYWHEIVERRSP